jgi:plasmid stability protein
MHKQPTRDFLIRNMPVELYNSLEAAAKAHHRSRTQEAIVALTNGLKSTPTPFKKPIPFQWGKKITNRFIREAIDEGRE